MLVGLLAALLPFLGAAAGTLLAVSGFTLFSVKAFDNGLWLNMAQPLGAMAVALFAGTAYQYFVEGAEKRVVKKLFGRYVRKTSTSSSSPIRSWPSSAASAAT